MTKYFCCDERRRNAVNDPRSRLNGIDFLEVDETQLTLVIHFLKPIALADDPATPGIAEAPLTAANVRIEGGEVRKRIDVNTVAVGSGTRRHVLTLTVDGPGDFAPYTLRIVRDEESDAPPPGYDPLLSAVDFSFKVHCPADADCAREGSCPPEARREPDLDYLARDYASFRQMMLDRMSALLPGWTERNPADLGVALVEVFAYVGDHLSYRQDAVATEAYLETARRRTSVRRHARLVDYPMHDGCNARAWVHFQLKEGVGEQALPAGTALLTRVPSADRILRRGTPAHREAMGAGPEVFETMADARFLEVHNEIPFYTWGDDECCLPKGATRATLKGDYPHLFEGDVLIFEEKRGPETGSEADADRTRRHAVRLVEVEKSEDPIGSAFAGGGGGAGPFTAVAVTEIRWMPEDALPFPFCISARVLEGETIESYDDVSVARGNVVLADHGFSFNAGRPEPLGPVPAPSMFLATAGARDHCDAPEPVAIPPRYRPRLAEGPLTHAAPFDPLLLEVDEGVNAVADLNAKQIPASIQSALERIGAFSPGARVVTKAVAGRWFLAGGGPPLVILHDAARQLFSIYAFPAARLTLDTAPGSALPALTLRSTLRGAAEDWTPRRDLLNSGRGGNDFVVEVESEGAAHLRFGDDQFGRRPEAGTDFTALYRIGGGARGNVGADTLYHAVSDTVSLSGVRSLRNPLPARGGVDPESTEAVRQYAPAAYRTQERAVTPEDYAAMAERHPEVQRAAATFRWTGSWRTVFLTVDRLGGGEIDPEFEARMRRHMERYRMAGYDLEIDAPRYVPLEVEMTVCVMPEYFRESVRAALLEVFSDRVLPDGRRGLFHPDNFTFGQAVYLSPLIAAAQAVEGIASVEVTKFGRQDRTGRTALDAGKLELERLEIARMENSPNFPKRGVFRLDMRGGK